MGFCEIIEGYPCSLDDHISLPMSTKGKSDGLRVQRRGRQLRECIEEAYSTALCETWKSAVIVTGVIG